MNDGGDDEWLMRGRSEGKERDRDDDDDDDDGDNEDRQWYWSIIIIEWAFNYSTFHISFPHVNALKAVMQYNGNNY